MELGIKGKNAFVTGGSHGIGCAIALGLAAEGVNVAICSRTDERVNATVKEIEAFGVKAFGVTGDVLNAEDIETIFNKVSNEFKTIDILVNNVGGGGSWGSENVEETSDEVWMQVYTKNALAAVRFTMRALPLMRKKKWGRVVSIASKYGKEAGGRPWFTMAKSAEIALMKTLALDPKLARAGITFNSVAPGNILIPETGLAKMQSEEPQKFAALLESSPRGRMGTAKEVADAVIFLCSERASHVTGALLAVDGGETKSF